jgi:hypothetical protein
MASFHSIAAGHGGALRVHSPTSTNDPPPSQCGPTKLNRIPKCHCALDPSGSCAELQPRLRELDDRARRSAVRFRGARRRARLAATGALAAVCARGCAPAAARHNGHGPVLWARTPLGA